MSANRTARNEAWIASLVLHAGLLAGIVAVAGRPREPAASPIVVNTRDTGHEIGVVLLDAPAIRPKSAQPVHTPPVPVKPLTMPVVQTPAPAPAPPPAPVMSAAAQEPART